MQRSDIRKNRLHEIVKYIFSTAVESKSDSEMRELEWNIHRWGSSSVTWHRATYCTSPIGCYRMQECMIRWPNKVTARQKQDQKWWSARGIPAINLDGANVLPNGVPSALG